MTYATQQNLTDRYSDRMLVQLTDRGDVSTGVIDVDVVNEALAETDALIDGYLKGRYKLPLAVTPPLVNGLAKQIAIYKLHTHAPDDKIKDEYDAALKTLVQISQGVVQLDVAGAEPEGASANGVQAKDRERDMTPENMKGFV